jgi:serine/threonine-protein kinase
MLTGTTPHAEIDGVFMIMTAICNTPAPPVQQRAPWVPAEHAAICHKLLQIDPKDRFASAAEALEAIRALLPGGLSIDEGMLAPLPAEVRETAAPLPTPSNRSFRIGQDAHGTGETALNVSTGAVVPVRSRRWPTIALGSLLIGAAIGAYKLQGEATPAAPGTAAETAAPAPTRKAPEPVQTASAAPAPEPRTVRLAVEPADAAVEIDGLSATVKDGAVELAGALGSVHHVRAVMGSDEAKMDVAITAQGAVPSSLRVQITPARPGQKPAGNAAAGRAPATPPPPSSTVQASKPKDPQPATKFE